ncbi:MAG: hypothetical protein WBC04_02965, partial [Candidatus Acidiferrales bacterium]
FHSPPVPQDLQQLRREHHVPVLLTFALLDTQDHSLAVDRGESESNGLGDAQAGCVAGGQDRAMLPAGNTPEKLDDFFRAQDNG